MDIMTIEYVERCSIDKYTCSECGGKTAYGFHRGGGLRVVGQYIANELYTETELKRRGDCLYMPYMDVVYIPKNKTFFNLGVRFEMR